MIHIVYQLALLTLNVWLPVGMLLNRAPTAPTTLALTIELVVGALFNNTAYLVSSHVFYSSNTRGAGKYLDNSYLIDILILLILS